MAMTAVWVECPECRLRSGVPVHVNTVTRTTEFECDACGCAWTVQEIPVTGAPRNKTKGKGRARPAAPRATRPPTR
jgi:hypothetical protein